MKEVTIFEVAELCEKLPIAMVVNDGKIVDVVVEEN